MAAVRGTLGALPQVRTTSADEARTILVRDRVDDVTDDLRPRWVQRRRTARRLAGRVPTDCGTAYPPGRARRETRDVRLERCDATLGARITGVRLAALDPGTWRSIEAAFLEHALLIFPAQHLAPEEQVAFARRFGEIEHLFGAKGWVSISNQRPDGSLLEDETPAMQIMRGNEGWHTDSSYMPCSARASVLSAHVVPTSGGQTEWADMRAAWDALDDATRARIQGLSAYHSIRYSQARIGHTTLSGAAGYGADVAEPPLRPLVKPHPATGRPALFIGRHAYGIPGLPAAESEALLDRLLDFACRPPRVLRHAWQPGDVAIWDNRCVLHRARPYDHAEPRVMLHVRVAGDPATEGVPATSC